MLKQEILEENKDLIKSYSDNNKFIVNQKGEKYAEAIDVAKYVQNGTIVYIETDEDIPTPEEPEEPEEMKDPGEAE